MIVDDGQLQSRIEPWLKWAKAYPNYERRLEEKLWHERHQQGFVATLEALFPNLERLRILEVGCGMGGLSVALRLNGHHVTALDANPSYCEITRLRARRHALELPVVHAPAENLPFPDRGFDVVVAFEVIEHVRDPRAVLHEMRRVLAPGGAAWVWFINRWAFMDPHYHLPFINWMPRRLGERIVDAAGRRKDGLPNEDAQTLSEMHYSTKAEAVQWARDAGFTRVLDLRLRKLEDRGHRPDGPAGWLLAASRALGVARFGYELASRFILRDFNFLLQA